MYKQGKINIFTLFYIKNNSPIDPTSGSPAVVRFSLKKIKVLITIHVPGQGLRRDIMRLRRDFFYQVMARPFSGQLCPE